MSETGHYKNVTNFKTLVIYCQGFGAGYNPGSPGNQLSNLQQQAANLEALHNAANDVDQLYNDQTNAREIVFKDFPKFATRVVDALEASDVPQQTLDDARAILRKIRGTRAVPVKLVKGEIAEEEEDDEDEDLAGDETETPAGTKDGEDEEEDEVSRRISVSQRGYDAQVDHFKKLISLMALQTVYIPNEPEFTIAALQTRLQAMSTANDAVAAVIVTRATVHKSRDLALYHPVTGAVRRARLVKKYVRYTFTPESAEYKKVATLKFKLVKSGKKKRRKKN